MLRVASHYAMNNPKHLIQNQTDLTITSLKSHPQSNESHILEVNEQWIFLFPKTETVLKKLLDRVKFQKNFSKISPLRIPVPEYISDNFIGYRKIEGTHPTPKMIEQLSREPKISLAKQFGNFLRILHSYDGQELEEETGYLVMRREDYLTCPEEFTKLLTTEEKRSFRRCFDEILECSENFVTPDHIIHGDFHFNNILWDAKNTKLTGVLDWSQAGRGIAAMDMIMLADFSNEKNDIFLLEMLGEYGSSQTELFRQVKANYIIDVMNWYWTYSQERNEKGKKKMLGKLKTVL